MKQIVQSFCILILKLNCHLQARILNPLLQRSHHKFSQLYIIQFLLCEYGKFGIGSTNNPLINIFLYSHHLSA